MTKLSKKARVLRTALSQLAMDYLSEGNLEMASRIHTVTNTLVADPKALDRLAKILQKVG